VGQPADFRSGNPDQDDPAKGGTWGEERKIRAEIIRELLTNSNPLSQVHSKGIDVRGARITGQLYLGGAALRSRLALIGCRIDEYLNLADASASSIALAGSSGRHPAAVERALGAFLRKDSAVRVQGLFQLPASGVW
jgi:hypothetical protein